MDNKVKKMMASDRSHIAGLRSTPAHNGSSANSEHKSLAALTSTRRALEKEVMQILNAKKEQKQNEDDGYEEICFPDEEHHYLTPRPKLDRSISDSDLLFMDENREIELFRRGDDTEDGGEEASPEQGFYRVYDDLERVREWDLIPYVITRKMRAQEEEEKRRKKKGKEQDKNNPDKKLKSNGSRASLDSGRASVVSSHLSCAGHHHHHHHHQQQQQQVENHPSPPPPPPPVRSSKRALSDSSSSCSADSGTYNLFDDGALLKNGACGGADFVRKVTLQLDSIRQHRHISSHSTSHTQPTASNLRQFKRVPPPPPPIANTAHPNSLIHAADPSNSSPPPPLPPRLKCIKSAQKPHFVSQPRRKDLTSFFGLLEDEPNQLLSKAVARTVAMQSLKETSAEINLNKENSVSSPLHYSPPDGSRKKDLNKYLGIQDDCEEESALSSTASSPSKNLLRRFGSSPMLKNSSSSQRASPLSPSSVLTICRQSVSKELRHRSGGRRKSSSDQQETVDWATKRLEENPPTKVGVATPLRCRRELDFDKVEEPTNNNGSKNPPLTVYETKGVQTSASPKTPGSAPSARRRRSAGLKIFRTPLLRGERAKSPTAASCNRSIKRRRSAHHHEGSHNGNDSPRHKLSSTPVFKSSAANPRRSFMAALLSAKKKDLNSPVPKKATDEEHSKKEAEEEEDFVDTASDNRDYYTETVREALRQGLPVIPFMQTPTVRPKSSDNNNDEKGEKEKPTSSNSGRKHESCCEKKNGSNQEEDEMKRPSPHGRGSLHNHHQTNAAEADGMFAQQDGNSAHDRSASVKEKNSDIMTRTPRHQSSGLYLSMNGGGGNGKQEPLVWTARSSYHDDGFSDLTDARTVNLCPERKNNRLPGGGRNRHCQSCTCDRKRKESEEESGVGDALPNASVQRPPPVTPVASRPHAELDYVRMEGGWQRTTHKLLLAQESPSGGTADTMMQF